MPLSPNMNLPIPVPSQTGGPQYALDEQSCFQQIDSHNHTPGQGSQIPLNALNVNQNLSMSGFSISALKSLQLNNQVISPGSSSLYMLGNDLYFADGTGAFNVQITSGNAVAVSGAVGFSGLPSGTASAAYLSLLGTFRFQSATNTAATLDVGPIKIRNTLASSNYVSLNAPNPLAASYDIVFPSSAPLSNKIMQMGVGGVVYNNLDVDNSTLQIVSNTIQVANNGITTTQILDGSVTKPKLAALGQQQQSAGGQSTSSGSFVTTGLSQTITSTGRPILISFNSQYIAAGNTGTNVPANEAQIEIRRNGVALQTWVAQWGVGGNLTATFYYPLSLMWVDVVVAGTYTYEFFWKRSAGSAAASLGNTQLTVFEL